MTFFENAKHFILFLQFFTSKSKKSPAPPPPRYRFREGNG